MNMSPSKLEYPYLGLDKRKFAFEHAQNVRNHILHMRKDSSGHLISIEAFYGVQ